MGHELDTRWTRVRLQYVAVGGFEQTEQTEQTSHAVLQLMQIACACGLVNLLQMVPVGFEKKTRGKKRPLYGKPPPFVPLRHSERSYRIMLQGCEMHS